MNNSGDIYSAKYLIVSAFDCREDCAFYVENGKIVDVSHLQNLVSKFPAARVHEFEDAAILPGFVNAHHHCFGVNLVNQGIQDDFLEPWIIASAGAATVSTKTLTEYAAIRLLKNGVTSLVDACTAGETEQAAENKVREKIRIYSSFGMSCAVAPGERWQNRFVHQAQQDLTFLRHLPDAISTKLERDHVTRQRLKPTEYLSLIPRLAEEYATVETANVWFGPTSPHWTGQDMLRRISRAANEHEIQVQSHAEETLLQNLVTGQPGNQKPVNALAATGLLNESLSLAHMVWADDRDLQQVAEAGAHVVCNPSSNLRLRSGTARAWKMKEFGINLGLGLDGTSLSGDDDMFAEMRLARNLYWPKDPRQTSLTSRDVLNMATLGGARLMGSDRRNGSLDPGKRADFILLNLERLRSPWISEITDPIELIVGSAKSSDIISVYVNGSKAVSLGSFCLGDEAEVLHRISEETEHSINRKLSEEEYSTVRSALLRWYDDQLTQGVQKPL